MQHPQYWLSVDIGGTFTDIVLLEQGREQILINKVLTTYPDPSIAVIRGVAELVAAHSISPSLIYRVVHGTTLVTNAIIERRGQARLYSLRSSIWRRQAEQWAMVFHQGTACEPFEPAILEGSHSCP